MARYFLSSLAESDIRAIWEYIAQNNVSAADRLIDRFTETFERIAQFPESGERFEHPKGEFRIRVVAPYLIFHRVIGDEVDIVRVLHGARHWENLL
jgi:toxin ParE1/3/4